MVLFLATGLLITVVGVVLFGSVIIGAEKIDYVYQEHNKRRRKDHDNKYFDTGEGSHLNNVD